MNIPYISAEEVRKNLSMEDAIQCTENVYKLKSQDKTVVWPTIFYEFDPGHADMDIKSGYLPEQHIFGHKTVAFMEANVQKGLPDLVGLIAVFSSETGMPLGLVDGSSVTGMRTGAAGAIGVSGQKEFPERFDRRHRQSGTVPDCCVAEDVSHAGNAPDRKSA